MYQQNSFQGGNAFGSGMSANTNRYQPAGYVPSYYQGQLTRSAASGPVTAHSGYQAGSSQGFGSTSNVTQGSIGSAASGIGGGFQQTGFGGQVGASTPQNPVYRATNARQQEGPVIQHLGYTAGVNQGYGQQTFGFSGGFQQQTGFGGQVGASTPQNPVYRATNARQQEGPVIQHLGYSAGMNQGYGTQQFVGQPLGTHSYTNQSFATQGGAFGGASSGFGMQQAGFGGQVSASTPQNPVYRATNARQQEGPVIQHLGYTAGTNQGYGAGSSFNNQNRYSF